MSYSNEETVAMVIAASFAAGLNVYATIGTLGLLGRFHLINLPSTLQLLENGWVIAAALALFAIEFVADKIPAFDLVWNALHTFVRVPAAALIGYQASAHLSPAAQLLTAVVAGVVSFAAHGGKTAVRAAVTPSPEPLSNIGLSLGEDTIAIGLAWAATTHPFWAAAVVAVMLLVLIVAMRFVFRALRSLFRSASQRMYASSDSPALD